MNLTEAAQRDWKAITSNTNEWGCVLTFRAPDDSVATVAGLHSKHHLGVDMEQNAVNSKHGHVTVSEALLTALEYPVRNTSGPLNHEVNLKGHKVSVKDSTERLVTYKIEQWFQDEKVGIITCILGDII
jgi:hypothetical protein